MRNLLAVLVFAAAVACGGSDRQDPKPAPWAPPVVDPLRVEDLCPAPDVPVVVGECADPSLPVERCWSEKPAGELQVGDLVYTGRWDDMVVPVTAVQIVSGKQLLRLTMTDGRTALFTPNHVFQIYPCESGLGAPPREIPPVELTGDLKGGGFVELQHLVPGVCVAGWPNGQVRNVENAPDGDVVEISIDKLGHPYAFYYAAGLTSVAHNSVGTY